MEQLRELGRTRKAGWAEQGEDQAGLGHAEHEDCGAWKGLRVKQRQRGLRRKEFPYMEEREDGAQKIKLP